MDEKMRKLRSESKNLKPGIIIGKNGINDAVIKNIKTHLRTYGVIKIKILKTYIEGKDNEGKDKKFLAKELANRCEAQLIDVVGFTVVLAKA
jgi:RNA-binding protein